MQTRSTSALIRLTLAALLAAAPVTAAVAQDQSGRSGQQVPRQASSGSITVPVSGLVGPEGADPTAALTGTLSVTRFTRAGDQLVAVGTLTANFADLTTGAARTIVTQVAVPVSVEASAAVPAGDELDEPEHGPAVIAQQQACSILHLELGPLDLNLLGLRVQLNQVVLDITAVPGAGNLLGNLLCAIAGLLDGTGQLARIVALLNQLLDVLG